MKFIVNSLIRMGVPLLRETTNKAKDEQIKLAEATHHLTGKKVRGLQTENKVYRIQVQEDTLSKKRLKKTNILNIY